MPVHRPPHHRPGPPGSRATAHPLISLAARGDKRGAAGWGAPYRDIRIHVHGATATGIGRRIVGVGLVRFLVVRDMLLALASHGGCRRIVVAAVVGV